MADIESVCHLLNREQRLRRGVGGRCQSRPQLIEQPDNLRLVDLERYPQSALASPWQWRGSRVVLALGDWQIDWHLQHSPAHSNDRDSSPTLGVEYACALQVTKAHSARRICKTAAKHQGRTRCGSGARAGSGGRLCPCQLPTQSPACLRARQQCRVRWRGPGPSRSSRTP